MSYIRKTKDEYEIQQYVCGTWEMVTTEETWKDAKIQKKCYRDNQPEYPCRIVKRRIPKED